MGGIDNPTEIGELILGSVFQTRVSGTAISPRRFGIEG
jgi:hypothetical protein